MAGISASTNILNILKIVYKDGVENLLFRSSPVLRDIRKGRIEGKEYRYAAIYGRGGAVSGNYNQAKSQAIETSRNVEFKVIPGQLFSSYTINQKEILASRTNRGAYMTAAGNKLFAALEAARKTLAAALYGTGYGEFGQAKAAATLVVGANTMEFDEEAIMAIDVGTVFRFSDGTPDGTLGASVNTVTKIDGNNVTFTATAADSVDIGDWMVLEGSVDSSGNPLLPVGLGAWLPSLYNRTGADWNTYIGQQFFGVDRSIAVDRLAGQFVVQNTGEKIEDTISRLFRLVRRAGGEPQMVILNDKKMLELMASMETQRSYWQSINNSDKKSENAITKGIAAIQWSFSTSWIEKTVDDPFCPYLTFYILDEKAVELVTYTNADAIINDGISDNAAGKSDPMQENGEGYSEKPHQINIEDFITVEDGVSTQDGAAVLVSANLYGSFVVYNPANCGVGKFLAA